MPETGPVSFDNLTESIVKIAAVVGKYGVAAIVFALPAVIGGGGVYFLGIAVRDPQVSMAKVSIGVFATLCGSTVSIVLLYVFTRMNLWDILGLSKFSKEQQQTLSDLQARVKVLEHRPPERIREISA